MSTKHIFLDIDGTLVGYDTKIPDSALRALIEAQKNGHKIIIASGRPLYMLYPELLEAISFDGIIVAGGACIVMDGEVIFESLIEDDFLANVIDYFKKVGIRYILQTKDTAFAEKDFEEIVIPGMLASGYNEELVEQAYAKRIIVDDLKKVKGANKLSYFSSPYTAEKIASDLGGKYYVSEFSVGNVKTELLFGELNTAGVTKATGIEKYLEMRGASIEDTIAIGDSGNDMEMIEYAGVSVAMGNATEQIKQAADFVTTAVDDDGIYNAFKKLGLIE